MKKIILGILVFLILLISFIVIKAATFSSKQLKVEPVAGASIDQQKAVHNLSSALQLKTISNQDPAKNDTQQFKLLHQLLETSFPGVHANLVKEGVNEFSLLYTWKGTDSNLRPIILLGHMDVVPIAEGTNQDWTHPPFSGRITDEFVWGRGAMDYKIGVTGMLEAVEGLLESGFRPKRTVYLAFGHDEEVGGIEGAREIAKLLKSRSIKAEWILDEGSIVISAMMPGISGEVALPGIAEKGYMTLELTVKTEGGHSSMPPVGTAIGVLASAIHNLERNRFPVKYEGVVVDMFEYAAPEMPFGMKLLFANKWLLKPVITGQLKKVAAMNAMLRTTIAPTIFKAGTKENVLPQQARAMVNFRLYPGDSPEYVIKHVTRAINDSRVKIGQSKHAAMKASAVTDIGGESFTNLQKTIHQIFPDAVVAPYLVVAGTDTRHYGEISDNIFRFLPLSFVKEDIKRFHGTNERVGIKNYIRAIQFYSQMIRNSN